MSVVKSADPAAKPPREGIVAGLRVRPHAQGGQGQWLPGSISGWFLFKTVPVRAWERTMW